MVSYCNKRKIDKFSTSVDNITEFLTDMFEAGYRYESVNSACSALSSLSVIQDSQSVGSHP